MKPTDFLSLLGFIVLFANAALERAGRNLPASIKPEWLTWGGLALVVLGFAFRVPGVVKTLGARRTKHGANTAVFVVVVAAILGAINWIADRNPKRFDLSKEQRFSLSPQTKQILGSLKQDVQMVYVQRGAEAGTTVRDRLNEYAASSNRVKVEYINYLKNPGRVRELGVTTVPTLVMKYGERVERISTDGEADITNALVKLTRAEKKTVCFASGEGERDMDDSGDQGYSSAKAALGKSQYETKKVVLLQEGKVPDDCTVLLVGGATKDIQPQVADYVKAFVTAGGKALLMNDSPTKAASPNFDTLLRHFGVDPQADVVVDVSGVGQLVGTGPFTPVVVEYPFHEINKDLAGTMSAFHMARSLKTVTPSPEGVVASEIAKTSARSWGETDLSLKEPIEPSDKEPRGAQTIAMAATVKVATATSPSPTPAPSPEGTEAPPQKEGRVVAVGDADFASNALFTFQANQDLFLNMVAWLAQDKDLISIRPKEPGTNRLDLTASQQRGIFYFSFFGLPGFFVAWGIYNWWRRRS